MTVATAPTAFDKLIDSAVKAEEERAAAEKAKAEARAAEIAARKAAAEPMQSPVRKTGLTDEIRRANQERREAAHQDYLKERFERQFWGSLAEMAKTFQWSSQYLRIVRAYAQMILAVEDPTTPVTGIDAKHARAILGKIQFALETSGYRIPADTLFGQRLLSVAKAEERAAKDAKAAARAERIVIQPGERPRGERPVQATANQADLPEATTPKGRRVPKRYRGRKAA